MRGKPPETRLPESVPTEPAPAEPPAPEPVSAEASAIDSPPEAAPPTRSHWWIFPIVVVVLVVVAGAVAATAYWAPAVMQALLWGNPPPPNPPSTRASPAAATLDDALAARVAALEAAQAKSDQNAALTHALGQRLAALEAAQAKSDQNAAAAQALGQRVAALEGRPAPDLTPLQNELTSLTASVAELTQKLAAIDKASAAPADGIALALLLVQIREAVEIGRPFAAEYQALAALSRNHPDIAAAAAPLGEPAKSGVASRAVLAGRLHQLAPQIAAAVAPAKSSWRSQIVARLRSLVTIRRIDGAGQSPAEAAVSNAERALASGDLQTAIDALSGLGGANLAAAQPWLGMAQQRLAVETALHQIEALVTAELGGAPTAPAKPG